MFHSVDPDKNNYSCNTKSMAFLNLLCVVLVDNHIWHVYESYLYLQVKIITSILVMIFTMTERGQIWIFLLWFTLISNMSSVIVMKRGGVR